MAISPTVTQNSLQVPRLNGREQHGDIAGLTGRLTDEGVHVDIKSVNWPAEYPTAPKSEAWLGHSDEFLYVLFSINPHELRAMALQDLDPVSRDTCFEIFVKPAGNTHYCNFEFNYRGVANVSRRTGRADAVKFTSEKLARIKRCPLNPVAVHDTRPASHEVPVKLLVEIPLDLIGFHMPLIFPAVMEGNIYSCSDAVEQPYYLSWSPIDTVKPDFHRPEFFKPIYLL